MAKVNTPLMSASAHGSFAKALTFAKNKSAQYVKLYSKPTDTNSVKQNAQRRRFSACILVWNALLSTAKKAWTKIRRGQPWCKNNPLIKLNLLTNYPCRETPNQPGLPYTRKSEWIIGLAKIGYTPMGTKTMNILGWQ